MSGGDGCRLCNKCGGRVFVVYQGTIKCLSCGYVQSIRMDRRRVAQHKINRAEVLLGNGIGVRMVAKIVGVSPMTISRLRRKMLKSGHNLNNK